jgi:hypothetical protein
MDVVWAMSEVCALSVWTGVGQGPGAATAASGMGRFGVFVLALLRVVSGTSTEGLRDSVLLSTLCGLCQRTNWMSLSMSKKKWKPIP